MVIPSLYPLRCLKGSFEALAEENMKTLREILDDAAASPEPQGSIKQKVSGGPAILLPLSFPRCPRTQPPIRFADTHVIYRLLAGG